MKIKFAVYFSEDYFEWQEVHENNKKLSEEELEEYQFYIEENGWGSSENSSMLKRRIL